SSNASFTVTVRDTTPPVITVAPVDITGVQPTGPGGAVVTYPPPTATDLDGPVTVVTDHPSGSLFPLGTTTVHYTATDSSGNTSTGVFYVTVADTAPPAIAPLDNVVIEATGPAGAVVNFIP